jgi:hypothetical protein
MRSYRDVQHRSRNDHQPPDLRRLSRRIQHGRLHGEWIDADQSADAIYEDVKRMLAASPEPGAEEWAIPDYEGFGELRLSGWESFEARPPATTGRSTSSTGVPEAPAWRVSPSLRVEQLIPTIRVQADGLSDSVPPPLLGRRYVSCGGSIWGCQ